MHQGGLPVQHHRHWIRARGSGLFLVTGSMAIKSLPSYGGRRISVSITPNGAVPGTRTTLSMGPWQTVPRAGEGRRRQEHSEPRPPACGGDDLDHFGCTGSDCAEDHRPSFTRTRAVSTPNFLSIFNDRSSRAAAERHGPARFCGENWHTYRHSGDLVAGFGSAGARRGFSCRRT